MDEHEHEKKGGVSLARSQITKQGLVQGHLIGLQGRADHYGKIVLN